MFQARGSKIKFRMRPFSRQLQKFVYFLAVDKIKTSAQVAIAGLFVLLSAQLHGYTHSAANHGLKFRNAKATQRLDVAMRNQIGTARHQRCRSTKRTQGINQRIGRAESLNKRTRQLQLVRAMCFSCRCESE